MFIIKIKKITTTLEHIGCTVVGSNFVVVSFIITFFITNLKTKKIALLKKKVFK